MSNSSPSKNEMQPLGSFASIIGILAIFLYFTGWIYRWAYFGFFKIEILRFDLPFYSFFFVPIQVFLGSLGAFLITVLAVMVTVLGIKVTIWFIQPLQLSTITPRKKWVRHLHNYTRKFHQFTILKFLRSLITGFPQRLLRELIIVIWLLISLFWLAKIQGTLDAYRDAFNHTSTLPVVTFVTPQKRLAIGRNPEDIFTKPALQDYRIIGSLEQLEYLQNRDINDATNPDNKVVWRLLLENSNWVYLFSSLPPNATREQRPPVLAIRKDIEGELMILSPGYSEK